MHPITCTDATNSQCEGCGTVTTTVAATTTTSLPPSLAHFNCYRTKDLKNPRFVPREDVSIVDQFTTNTVDVKKPFLLCAPASQDGSAVADPTTHLCCYTTKAPALTAPARAETADDFGTLQVQVKKSSLVCAPCTTTLLP